jgi:Leucine-rich repeat (LRR) protein
VATATENQIHFEAMKTKILNLSNSSYKVRLSLWNLLFNKKYYENLIYLKLRGSIFGKELPRFLYQQINLENVKELTIENFRRISESPFFSDWNQNNKAYYEVPFSINRNQDKDGEYHFLLTMNGREVWKNDFTIISHYHHGIEEKAISSIKYHQFANLQELTLINGEIENFPNLLNYFVMYIERFRFSFLKTVNILKCRISDKDFDAFPPFVKKLMIINCGLSILPKGLYIKNNLKILDIANNKIDFVPDFIDCNNLCELDLRNNQVSDSAIGKLPLSLIKLNLAGNPLKVLPMTILDLENLESLDISRTSINDLANSLQNASKLSKLREIILKNTYIEPFEKKKLVDTFPKVKFIFE